MTWTGSQRSFEEGQRTGRIAQMIGTVMASNCETQGISRVQADRVCSHVAGLFSIFFGCLTPGLAYCKAVPLSRPGDGH